MSQFLSLFPSVSSDVRALVDKVIAGERITTADALVLYDQAPVFLLSSLAQTRKRQLSGNQVFYNRNFHIEPTNVCRFHCRFCSFRKETTDTAAWDFSLEEIVRYAQEHYTDQITEIHLVGGVHPAHTLEHYIAVIRTLKTYFPGVVIKAFSAIEHIAMIHKAGLDEQTGIDRLLEAGLDTITGGGAEIFDEQVRASICPDKPTAWQWLSFHERLHEKGIKTTSTMLYGHIENIEHRIDHLNRLRLLQDRTGGFLSFIPLKFRASNNSMSSIGECSIVEDLKTLAISRIFLDNFRHIKAYWPMYGKQTTRMALLFGADDIDGTIADTTKIYSMAGVSENVLDEEALRTLISEAGFIPTVRDSFYRVVAK